MSRPRSAFVAALAGVAFVAGAPIASATDWTVDATGAGGAFTTIDAAMAVAHPGDRILVQPGSYPQFGFTVGVSVIGLGADPSAVVVQEIYFHISDPSVGYDALLQNLTLRSDDPADTLLLHGNEAGPGSVTIDGVRIDGGGVYLHGGQEGFYVHISDCDIKTQQGYGFDSSACYVGGPGNFVDLRNTRIVGWDAWPAFSLPAGVAVRIAGGSHVRIFGCEISGGAGGASSDPSFAAGGDAVGYGLTGDSDLLIAGDTVITGGAGNGAAGGDGVSIEGTILVGQATITGGAGTPPGEQFGLDDGTFISTDHALAVEPALKFADGVTYVTSGQDVSIGVNPAYTALIVLAFSVDVPASKLFFPLSPAQGLIFVPANEVSGQVPSDPSLAMQGLMVYAQAVVIDPTTNRLALTNAATLRIDLL